jgi:hypothetical protein
MGRNVTRDDGEKRRTDAVIDAAHDNRDELLAAIAKLEQFANEVKREANRRRGDNEKGG